MKKVFLSLFVAMLATVAVQAQQIAVVTGSTTKMCQTLKDAIEASSDGSVIYLPGGGFQIGDTVKITNQVTIMGIGHKANSENADGNTVISGNLFFNEGSSGSAVMGCYISGNVVIGEDESSVNSIHIKYCNLNSVQVKNSNCWDLEVNQNYIRNVSDFRGNNATITNNILHSICDVNGGLIANNLVLSWAEYRAGQYGLGYSYDVYSEALIAYNTTVKNNIFIKNRFHGSGMITSSNMLSGTWGDECVNIGNTDWDGVFVKYNGGSITPASDFHFKEAFQQYSNIGIYGGTGFKDDAMPPAPYIVEKEIPEQTDASGKLAIKIRVKASE